MALPYTTIGRPPHEFGRECSSPEAYRGLMVQHLRDGSMRFPHRTWGVPHSAVPQAGPLVRSGVWLLPCSCGEYPIYSPEWQTACCFNCGAMYDNVVPPKDLTEIERILLLRPRMQNRNWDSSETVAMLRDENLQHGDPV